MNVLDPLEENDETAASGDNEQQTKSLTELNAEDVPIEQTAEPPDEALPLDVVFDILRNRRRRLVLSAIEERDGSTTLSELAEHIGGIENSKSPHALNAQERKRVYVGLYQCHLPKMDDAGAIEFEQNRGTVERGPHAGVFHTYLDREPEDESRWYRYYGPLAGLGFLSVGVSAILASSLVPVIAAVSLFAILVVTLVHATVAAGIDLRSLIE